MTRLEKLQEIVDEVYEDYGWTLSYDLDKNEKVEDYKKDFIEQFRSKCYEDAVNEDANYSDICNRVQNV